MLFKHQFAEVTIQTANRWDTTDEAARRWAAAHPEALAVLSVRADGFYVSGIKRALAYIAVQGQVHPTPDANGTAGFCPGCGRFVEAGSWSLARTTLGSDGVRHIVQGPWCPECGPQDGTRYETHRSAWLAAYDANSAATETAPPARVAPPEPDGEPRPAWWTRGPKNERVTVLADDGQWALIRKWAPSGLESLAQQLRVPSAQIHYNTQSAMADADRYTRRIVARYGGR